MTPPLTATLQRHLPAAAKGCPHSYGCIVQACQNTVTAIALAITCDVEASEDIAQEVFIKAWQRLNQLNHHDSFLSWLRQITRNLARDWLRANRHRPLSGDAAELAIGMAADPSPGAAEQLQRSEEEQAAEDIISALPADSRETLLLFYREGQSSRQVARLLGVSDSAVRKRLSRARAGVRAELLLRFGEFARSSAPGGAFAATLGSALLATAPGSASAAVLLGTGIGGGKLGLGAGTAAGGAALGSLSAALSEQPALDNPAMWIAAAAGMLLGMLLSHLGGRYLLSYAQTSLEREQLRGFVTLNTTTGLVMGLMSLMLSVLQAPLWVLAGLLALGLATAAYQSMFTLHRIMQPMLARDAARHGRRGPDWKYRMLYGRHSTVPASLLLFGAVLWLLRLSGRY